MNIQNSIIRPQVSLQNLAQSAPLPVPVAPSAPQETFSFSSRSDNLGDKLLKNTARVGLVAGGAALGTLLGSASGFLPGVAGAAIGVIGGGTLGYIGGALSTKLVSFDDYGLTNVFGGAAIGAIGGLAAGIAAGGFHSGTAAIACLGLLGAGAGTMAAIQV